MSPRITIPPFGAATLKVPGRNIRLTNLDKPFWIEPKIAKGGLIHNCADVAAVPRPDWIRSCAIEHDSGNLIDSPVIDDLPSFCSKEAKEGKVYRGRG